MIDFQSIKQRYSENPQPILRHLVGKGKIEGGDYVALNPKRNDSRLGSFRIDIQTGRFHDFATGDRGGSILDLASFVYDCDLLTAAQKLQELFPFLASTSVAADIVPAKKKKLDSNYIWSLSTVSQHKYLNKKKVTIGNARVNLYEGNAQLVIPLTGSCPTNAENLQIKGLQFIKEDGRKSFPLPFKALFHVASDYGVSKETIVICEGCATARSIAESIDYYVIAAMSACNLKCVVEKIAKQFPNSKIVIAADNDEAGRKAAEDAKRAVKTIEIVYPTHGCNDFNDLHVAYGADAVKACFKEVNHVGN